MKKILVTFILCLFAALRASGQSTALSGTVTDAGAQTWNNGTFQLTFQPNPSIPQGPYTWTGGTLPTSISGVLNSVGAFSVSVPSNTAISPIGTSWNMQVCPQATSPCFSVNNITIAGATQTFNLTPPAIQISLINPPSSPMLAYSDSEISSAVIGSFYLNIPILNYRYCQAVTGQTCTLWNTFGSGPPPTGNPRLDQVLNQNQAKTFNQGGAAIGFTAGPGLNLSGETSPLTVPVIVSCTTAAPGQICDDGTNYHIFVNGVDTLLVFSSSPILSGNNGDVAGYKVVGSQVSLQDLGPVNANTGNTFINLSMTTPLDGDQACWNAGGPPFWMNCTPGAADTAIAGATNAYTISFNDQLSTIDHDAAGSVSATITIPTATTLGINPGFVFSYSNHSTHVDTLAPTTWTINGSATLLVAANTICNKIRVDPNSATNWLTECSNLSGGGGTVTGTGSPNTMTKWTAASVIGNSSCTDDGSNPTRCPNGSNTATNGNYEEYTVDTGGVTSGLGLCVTANVDGSGRPKVLACSHTAVQPGAGFVGIARSTVVAGGTVAVCWTVNCSATFDNTSVALHEAILSVTTDGQLHDTGVQTATSGQPNFSVLNANGGAGTNALISLTGMLAQNPNGGGGNGKNVVQHGISFSIGTPGGTALTVASTTTDYITVPFACTIKSWNLAIDAGTITVKFWKVATGTAIPTSGNSISTSGVSISSGTAIHSTTLTDFTTTSVAANDIMAMNVTAVATAAFVNGVLECDQ